MFLIPINPISKYIVHGVIWIFLFFCFSFVGAQTNKKLTYLYQEKLQKANSYYEVADYKNAIELYKEIVEKTGDDTAIICKTAGAYRLLNDTKSAEAWYRRAVVGNESSINPIYKLYFAQTLTTNGKYEEAKYWFGEYNKTVSTDSRAFEGIKSIENLSRLYYDTVFYIVYPVSLNTKYSEFAPCFYKNGIVFLSDRNTVFYKEKSTRTNKGFLELYFSGIDSTGDFSKPIKFNKDIAARYNEGPFTFFDDDKKMIFTKNQEANKIEKNKLNVVNLQLFSASQDVDGEWKNIQPLNFNDIKYSFAQPSVTKDGKTLYFSSNMPGGYGGADIYVSNFENGLWSMPTNMGAVVNTPGDEMFPHIYNDTVLYFSSNGHGGLGGMDIFKINLKDSHNAENMGVPINSENDDLGIIFDKDGLSGYLASDRPRGMGAEDIYGFKIVRITITVKIIDGFTALPIADAEIFSADSLNEKKLGVTDQEGSCTLIVPVCKSFQIKIKKDNYETKIYAFESIKLVLNKLTVIPIKTQPPKVEKILLTDENNKPIDNPKEVIYKVQIFASRVPASDRELKRKYKGELKINDFYENQWYKYSIGEYSSYTEARQCCFSCNVFDAFIIAYLKNKKIHISEAKTYTKETDVKSPITRTDRFIENK
jgi:tetratricopeptide (TPR) repeat protein